jgi:hypothetical protein
MIAEAVRLKLFTQGGEEHDIETSLDIPTADFITEVVTALDFPTADADGQPIPWRLDNKDTSRTLDPTKTLEQNGVRSHHTLSLIRPVIAGGTRS